MNSQQRTNLAMGLFCFFIVLCVSLTGLCSCKPQQVKTLSCIAQETVPCIVRAISKCEVNDASLQSVRQSLKCQVSRPKIWRRENKEKGKASEK